MGDLFGALANVVGSTENTIGAGNAAGAVQSAVPYWTGLNPNVQMPDVARGDPATQAIQNQLLQTAIQRIRAGGLNAADLGRLQDIRDRTAQMGRASQGAALSDAQQRGALQGNSGILGSMVAGQAAADRASQEGLQANAQALQEQNQMLSQGAGMAQGLRGQNIDVEQGNIERAMQQRQQNYNNAVNKATGISNTEANVGNAYNKVGSAQQGLAQGVGNFGSGAINAGVGIGAGNVPWQQYFGIPASPMKKSDYGELGG